MGPVRLKFANWRIDEDGILKVRARALSDGVFTYLRREFDVTAPDDETETPVLIDAVEFTQEALSTLSGMPVVIDEHEWRTAENALKDGYTVGSCANACSTEDGGRTYVVADLTILDPGTIERVKNRELCEISAGYRADYFAERGVYKGERYEAAQRNLVFNHVLLLPAGKGRCGRDVKIINQKKEKAEMPETVVTVKIGNRTRNLRFANEADASAAHEAIAEQAAEFEAKLSEARTENARFKNESEEKEEELKKAKAENEKLKEEVKNLSDDSAQEKRARELAEQDKDEEAVVENEFSDDKEKEEVKNALKSMNRQARAEHLAKTVLNKKGLDAGDWDAGRLAGAFRAIALNAKAELKARSETAGTGKVVNGALPRTGNGASEGPSRMFNVFNKKETK